MADQPTLTVLGGPLGGRRFAFEDGAESVLIGSDPSCTFRLELPGVSPIHARVRMDASGITVYDTQSPRGLFVNDDRVTSQMPLRNGDVLWLGTPGEPGVVMIQCRVAPGAGASAAAATPTPPPGTDATQAVTTEDGGMYVEPILDEPEPTVAMAPPEPEPTISVAPDEPAPTLIQSPPAGADSFFGENETQSITAPASAPWSSPPDEQLPTSFTVEPTVIASPPPAVHFEDEDEGAPSESVPTVMMTPPAETPMVIAPAAEPPPPPSPARPPAPANPPRPASSSGPRPAAKPGPPSMRVDPATRPKPGPPSMPPRAPVVKRPTKAGGGGMAPALIGGGALLLLAGGAAVWFFVLNKPAAQTTEAPPAPTAVATAPPVSPTEAATEAPTAAPTVASPTPVEVVTMVNPTSAASAAPTAVAPRAAATPTATKPAKTQAPTQAPATPNPAAQAAAARGQAERALAAGQADAAVGYFEEALRLVPGDAEATAGRTKAIGLRDALKRRFVAGTTSARSSKQGKADLTGFESSDVKVAGALEYSGRIDFEVRPDRVKPGDSYAIKVLLTNDGKKELKIGSANVTYAVNGNKSGGPVNAKVKSVAPQGSVLLGEFPGVWGEGTTSWTMEVVVTSNRDDTFRNQLSWK